MVFVGTTALPLRGFVALAMLQTYSKLRNKALDHICSKPLSQPFPVQDTGLTKCPDIAIFTLHLLTLLVMFDIVQKQRHCENGRRRP